MSVVIQIDAIKIAQHLKELHSKYTKQRRFTCNRRLSGAEPCEITKQACQNLSKFWIGLQSKLLSAICDWTVHRMECNPWCACPSSSSPQLSVNHQIAEACRHGFKRFQSQALTQPPTSPNSDPPKFAVQLHRKVRWRSQLETPGFSASSFHQWTCLKFRKFRIATCGSFNGCWNPAVCGVNLTHREKHCKSSDSNLKK